MIELTPSTISGILFLFSIGICALIGFAICYLLEERIKGCKKCDKYNHELHICQYKIPNHEVIKC